MAAVVYSFGPFRLDKEEKTLRRGDEIIELTPKAIETLLMLVENSGHIVTHEELRRAVWPNTFVEPSNLAHQIVTIRKALGESAECAQYLQTVARRGYRFIAPVSECAEQRIDVRVLADVPPVALPSAVRLTGRPLWLLALSLLAVGLVAFASWRVSATRGEQSNSIAKLAVLPLANLSGDPSQEYFADGVTDAIITNLAKIGSLRVTSRSSVMQFKGRRESIAEIVRELHVDAVVEGTVLRSGNHLRITAQLIDGRTDRNLWAETYDRTLNDSISLERDVATDIAQSIKIQVTSAERQRLSKPSFVDSETQDEYLRGRFFWNKRTEEGYLKAIEHFRNAIARDPTFAEAYAGLADAYALLGSMDNAEMPRSQAMVAARKAALKAIRLDDSLAEAHTSLAFVKMHYDWDWPGAEAEFRRAIELKPSYATAHHWYTYYLMAQGRKQEALEEIQKAQTLDPLSLIINTDFAEMLYYDGRYDEGLQQVRRTLDMDPNFALAYQIQGFLYLGKRDYRAAISSFERQQELGGSSVWGTVCEAIAYAREGRTDIARKLLDKISSIGRTRYGISVLTAAIYASLDDKDQAFASLEQGFRDRDGGLMMLNVDPEYAPLRSDPRFAELTSRIGIPR